MAQKKPAGKPIKITLTESQISDIIQRAAKTRRSIRVESLEDRIAPSRIGLPIFGGAEDADKFSDAPPAGSLPGEEFPEGSLPGEQFPGDGATTDGSTDPFAPELPTGPGEGDAYTGDPLDNPTGVEDPLAGDPLGGEPEILPPGPGEGDVLAPELDPNVLPEEQASIDEAANVEFNENLHMQGGTPDSGLTAGEMEEHRLNILRQLRGQ